MAYTFERLAEAGEVRKHLCVGLDPTPEFAAKLGIADQSDWLLSLGTWVVDATAHVAACYKPNLWFWIRHPDGLAQLGRVIALVREKAPWAPVILDGKVGDIGNTTREAALFARSLGADAVTANPYMGIGDIAPEFDKVGLDQFFLAKTSNLASSFLQDRVFIDSQFKQTTVAAFVATSLAGSGKGAVVGATDIITLSDISLLAPSVPFLIPGVGAQGAAAFDVAFALADHQAPWVVNVGRGVMEASSTFGTYISDVARAAERFHSDLAS